MSSREDILARMDALGIRYEHYTHPPVASAADRFPMGVDYGAQVCKNLLVSPRNESRFFLLMLPYDCSADLKRLRDAVGTGRLQFAPTGRLEQLLEQKQGTVGVCGVIHDREKRITIVFDRALYGLPRIAMHPGVNTETIVLSFADLERYLHSCKTEILYFDFSSGEDGTKR